MISTKLRVLLFSLLFRAVLEILTFFVRQLAVFCC